jgi:hypothetical protein
MMSSFTQHYVFHIRVLKNVYTFVINQQVHIYHLGMKHSFIQFEAFAPALSVRLRSNLHVSVAVNHGSRRVYKGAVWTLVALGTLLPTV